MRVERNVWWSKGPWLTEGEQLSALKRRVRSFARVFSLAARGFLHDEGLHRASALAFDTVLGLVPFCAFVVALLKGFGSYDALVNRTMRPGLDAVLVALGSRAEADGHDVVGLRGAFTRIFDFVDRADFGTLGAVGLVALLYVVVLMLVSIEASMNHIFGVERSRSVTRRVSDYSAILFITPLSATIAAAVAAIAGRVDWPAAGLLMQAGAVVTMGFGLTMLYVVMPFSKVRVRSALLGGFVASLLFFLVLALHVKFQIGVARYNAIYSTFAAIPLFLIWLFTSWLVVLFGAELVAAHQNPLAFEWRIRGKHAEPAAREYVAIRAMTEIGACFVEGLPAPTPAQLAATVRVPSELVEQVLAPLVREGYLARGEREGQKTYLVARDVDTVHLSALLDAIAHDSGFSAPEPRDARDKWVRDLLDRLHEARLASHDPTLRELAASRQGAGPRP